MRNLKRALSLALASVMVLGMTVVGTGASYTDVTSKQNQEAIEVLQAVGIMVGDDKGNFNPDQKVTRNEMAVVMSNLMDYRAATYAGTSPFTDVPSWAEPYVAACWTNGITSGYTKTTYGGSDTVTTSQAALMLMKALGYFQYQSDFGADWQFATIKKASQIDLFDDVDSGVREAMTRNDLAQLVLNALESGTVEAEKDGQDIEVNGVTISSNVKYNYITSGKDYAKAINKTLTANNDGTKSNGYIVELGEKLYNGDLKKADNGDNFNRPGSTWTYKSNEIGKYADSADGEWTAKVTNKALYDAAGSDAYDNYKWTVSRNGVVIAEDDVDKDKDGNITKFNDHKGLATAFGLTYDSGYKNVTKGSKTSSERVYHTGDGVLTQVFVDSEKQTAVLSIIDTGVAKVTKVTEDSTKGEYEVTLSFKTKVYGANGSITPDTKFTSDVKFNKDDVVVYTASDKSGEVESLAVAKTVAGKVTAQKDADYTTIDGTKYGYNYAYTAGDKDVGFIQKGLYDVDNGDSNKNPSIDKDATLYLDAYGYVVAFEGKTSTAEDYLFVDSLDTAFGDVSAKVVFFDGTKKTIDIDKVTLLNNGKDGRDGEQHSAKWTKNAKFDVKENNITEKTVYKFTAGSSDYDLEEVEVVGTAKENGEISNKTPSIKNTSVTGDSQTVYVDVENNKTWTGYKNVANKSNANIQAVIKDGVAEIVFIYGDNLSSSANDDDFVILKGTGTVQVKDSNKKTVYRFTDAYDIHGNKIEDLCAVKSAVDQLKGKGLYLIKDYDDEKVQNIELCKSFQKNDPAGATASIYADSCKNGVLTLNTVIDLKKDTKQDEHKNWINTADDKRVFAIDDKTEYVVIQLKEGNDDVDTIYTGSQSDITSWADADSNHNDVTGVYVMTVDNDTDDTPLAETILVIMPYVK